MIALIVEHARGQSTFEDILTYMFIFAGAMVIVYHWLRWLEK